MLMFVVFAGVNTFRTISRRENPEFTIRKAMVITYFPGASPQRVEELVTDKLEKKIRSIPEVDHVKSQSMTGISIINVEVAEKYNDMKPIWEDLRNKISDAKFRQAPLARSQKLAGPTNA